MTRRENKDEEEFYKARILNPQDYNPEKVSILIAEILNERIEALINQEP